MGDGCAISSFSKTNRFPQKLCPQLDARISEDVGRNPEQNDNVNFNMDLRRTWKLKFQPLKHWAPASSARAPKAVSKACRNRHPEPLPSSSKVRLPRSLEGYVHVVELWCVQLRFPLFGICNSMFKEVIWQTASVTPHVIKVATLMPHRLISLSLQSWKLGSAACCNCLAEAIGN